MGCVVGHEMTHGFDDKGRKFNFEGNMVDWWTSADGEEYERRVSIMVKQANEFDVFGQKVKGEFIAEEKIYAWSQFYIRALILTIDFCIQASSPAART